MKCFICSNKKNFKKITPAICKAENFLCLNCGLVFIPSRSKKIQEYYKQNGYFKQSLNISYRKIFTSKRLLQLTAKRKVTSALKVLAVNLNGKKIMDVGCGYGEVLYYFRKKFNCKVNGLEASPETVKEGVKIFSVPIRAKLLEEFKPKEKYDLVWCSHILEHVWDPNTLINKVKELVSKDGLIYIEVPNVLKPSGGFDLDTFFYNEHLQTFSAYNLYLLLKKHNLNVTAFSDNDFLRFWGRISGKNDTKPNQITSQEILDFLIRYKKNYNLLNYALVYSKKLFYGLNLAICKVYDLL